MRNELKNLGRSIFRPVVAAYYVAVIVLLAAYILLYQYTPLEAALNDTLLNTITSLSALIVSIIATHIFRHYQPDDKPRLIWKNLMLSGWMWLAAELSWQLIDFLTGDVPTPGIADGFWFLGYIYFTFAFYHQYVIILPDKKETIRIAVIEIWLVILLLPALLLTALNSFTLPLYIDFFYPFADLAVGLAGLALILILRGGALMRPWIGLMLFGLSDLMYAWAEKTDMYAMSAENGNLLSLFIDTSYIAAYLLLGFGYLGHWVLLHYGVRTNRKK